MNQYTPEQESKLRQIFAQHGTKFPLNKIPKPTRWRVLIMPFHVADEINTKGFEALSKLNEGKGLIKHQGIARAEHYNRAHGHVVAIGDMYGYHHTPVVVTDYEASKPTRQRAIFPQTATIMPEIGDHVTLGKWSGQYLEATHDGETIKFKIYNDDEILAVIDEDVDVKTKTQEELGYVPSDFRGQTT